MPGNPTTTPASQRRRWYRRHRLLRRWLAAGTGATALAWGGCLLWRGDFPAAPWAAPALLAMPALFASSWTMVWRHRTWHLPIRRMKHLLPRIIDGTEPIDALTRIDGAAAELVPAIQAILHALRRQEADTNELHAELGQRVARRTDALERVIGSLRQQATRDALTGLCNRRALDEMFPRLLRRCHDAGEDLCVVMADIDSFKRLNDTLGHAAGDAFLRSVGQLIRSSLRETDLAFRCGGDEFVLLMPGQTPQEAAVVVQRLQGLIEALARTLKLPVPPTLSVGLSAISRVKTPTVETLTRDADARLYQSKHRNTSAA